jgi:uncharacterized protein (DUF427 family)
MTKQVKWKLEPSGRWVRAQWNDAVIADSKQVLLLIESGYQLDYYFPQSDVRMDLLKPNGQTETSGYKGTAVIYDVQVAGRLLEKAAWTYPKSHSNRPDLKGYIAFKWDLIDHWYEEDEEVFVHPRNPYHRVDTILSSRHVRVVVDGQTVADTNRATFLFETGLPTRYYIPQVDVRMDLLQPTETHTRCPYKGEAAYWNVTINGVIHQDVVWGYPYPIAEIPKIKGLVSFYNEKLDIYVDDVLEEKPQTVWS